MTLTALEILERCRRAEVERARLREKCQTYRDIATHMGVRMDGIGSHGSGGQDRMAAIVGEIDAAERALKKRSDEYAAEVVAAGRLLEQLPVQERCVLRDFYLKHQPLKTVASALGYSYGYVRSLKAAGRRRLGSVPAEAVEAMLPGWYVEAEREKRTR